MENSQRRLRIDIDGKTILSKPFDFEAMCLIDDARFKDKDGGALRTGFAALPYMFDQTEITDEILNNLSGGEKVSLAKQVYSWYITEMVNAPKNDESPSLEA